MGFSCGVGSHVSQSVKKRKIALNEFITPLGLAKKAIDMVPQRPDDVWLDPFRNSGHYYNQFPCVEGNRRWTEILDGKDFMNFSEDVDVVCSNPPYSILDKVIEKTISLRPRVINYLLGINNLTARRMEILEKAGYGLRKMHMCKVFEWYGMSLIVQFERECDSILSYDRTVWRTTSEPPSTQN